MPVFRERSEVGVSIWTVRLLASGVAWSLAYASALGLGLALRDAPPYGYAVVYPANGVIFSLLLGTPYRYWPVVFSVRVIIDVTLRATLGDWALWSPVVVGVSVLETAGGAYLVRRFVFYGAGLYSDLRRVIWFLALVAAFSGAVAAGFGVLLAGSLFPAVEPVTKSWHFWLSWWRSDALGIFLVAPVVVTWRRSPAFPSPDLDRPLESAVILVLSLAVAWLVFGFNPDSKDAERFLPYPMLIVPMMIWALVRSDIRLVSLLILLVGVVSAWQTHLGRGPFALLGADGRPNPGESDLPRRDRAFISHLRHNSR